MSHLAIARAFALALAALAPPALAQDGVPPVDFGDGVAFGGDQASFGTPDIYVVQPGDTLWEISSRFLGNPFYWPRLWSINEYITNPHWIYPGNRIAFRMGTLIDPPRIDLDGPASEARVRTVDIVDAEAECGPDVRFDGPRSARQYIANGFLADKGDVDIYGTVKKARGIQTFLADHDLIYLEVNDPEAYACGDVVSVFRRTRKKVRHPDRRSVRFGSLYKVVAEARVVHRHGDYLTAVIRKSWQEVQRGDLVGPAMPVAIEIEVGEPKGDLDGTIVERVSDEWGMLAPGEAVFIDRGRADGVRVGNTFYAVEQRDEHVDLKKEDTELPYAVIGRIVVVRVDEYASTAVVTDANRSIPVGTRVRQHLRDNTL